jgi:DNA-binding NarL/FixJ family response regulator
VPVRVAPRGAPLADAAGALGAGTVLADLGEPGMLDALRAARLAAPRVRVVGFLGHLQTDLARAAAEAGVHEVLSRGQLVQQLDAILVAAGGEGAPASDPHR